MLFFGSKNPTPQSSFHEESLPHRPPCRWACGGCAGNEPLVPRRAGCRRESHIRDLRGTSPQHLAAPAPPIVRPAPQHRAHPFGHTSHRSPPPVLVPCRPCLLHAAQPAAQSSHENEDLVHHCAARELQVQRRILGPPIRLTEVGMGHCPWCKPGVRPCRAVEHGEFVVGGNGLSTTPAPAPLSAVRPAQ